MEIKGIIHAHSHFSYDAKMTLPDLRTMYMSAGLRFVCMTEHTDEMNTESAAAFVTECAQYSDEAFMFIPGFEVPYRSAHILLVGMREFFDVYAPTIEVLKKWTTKAPFVILAHPVRNSFEVGDDLLAEIDALEVWNQQYEGKWVPRTRSLKLLETLRKKKPELIATGGVDLHRKEHLGSPVVTLTVDAISEEQILKKLQMGAFRVSSPYTAFYGTLPNVSEVIRAHRIASAISVSIIVLGKGVNKILASLGLSLPKSWKERIRRKL